MTKFVFFVALFGGLMMSTAKTEASMKSVFKGLETLYNSPWDPRNGDREENANQPPEEAGQQPSHQEAGE